MRTILMAAALLTLAACSPPAANTSQTASMSAADAEPAATEAIAVNGCPAQASSTWSAGAVATFTITASASGAGCADAQATISIADAGGVVVHTATLAASATQALAGAESVPDMERMLREWITPAGASRDSTGDLAPWPAGAPEPSDAEVPFHPAAGVTRSIYEALRAADAPMYCYEQSREGALCFTLRDGALAPIGVQTFAG